MSFSSFFVVLTFVNYYYYLTLAKLQSWRIRNIPDLLSLISCKSKCWLWLLLFGFEQFLPDCGNLYVMIWYCSLNFGRFQVKCCELTRCSWLLETEILFKNFISKFLFLCKSIEIVILTESSFVGFQSIKKSADVIHIIEGFNLTSIKKIRVRLQKKLNQSFTHFKNSTAKTWMDWKVKQQSKLKLFQITEISTFSVYYLRMSFSIYFSLYLTFNIS